MAITVDRLTSLDDLLECGVSVHDPQVRANTIDGIAAHYKDKLCANVDLDRQMFPFCTADDIRRITGAGHRDYYYETQLYVQEKIV